MTVTSPPTSTRPAGGNALHAARSATRLRFVLAANAATSAIVAIIGLLATDWASTTLGIQDEAAIRIVSGGLLIFAATVGAAAWRGAGRLGLLATIISAVDATWVAATVGVLALGDLSTRGTALAIVLGVGVAGFAALQLWLTLQIRRCAQS
jgi:hypothetical protein